MKRMILPLLAATTLAAGAPSLAFAQGWNINERQAQLDQRIDAGVRSGDLNPREADRLREEFREITRLERQYRADGLSDRERRELDSRFDQLSERVRSERRDDQV